MSDYIPDQLLVNVLLRLPFDSLIRSRCVSKSWRSLIDGPHFIKMYNESHLETNYDHNDTKIVALIEEKSSPVTGSRSRDFYSLDMNLLFSSCTANAKKLNFPADSFRDDIRLVGSCNGLLCLVHRNWNIFIWNPWTQKYWEIPPPPYGNAIGHSQVQIRLGFGYDRVSDDYKVLAFKNGWNCMQILTPTITLCSNKVYVYSSNLNLWKDIGDFPFQQATMFPDPMDGILANGALHWVGGQNFIFAFDLCSDKFRSMLCPFWEDRFLPQLCILNGVLCLLSDYDFGNQRFADIFLMEDYGVHESCWSKLGSIRIPFGKWTTPIALSKNKKQVVLQISKATLVLYDLETNSFNDVAMSGAASSLDSPISLTSCVCVGSLASLFWQA
ncbi:F-box protein CPR1-like [Coffea arabica]|uniref:F-box protein CPR1-like n=1 Tax=Coffea arabica TaxID=13443 RepID=A0ABM4WB74_COFAR